MNEQIIAFEGEVLRTDKNIELLEDEIEKLLAYKSNLKKRIREMKDEEANS